MSLGVEFIVDGHEVGLGMGRKRRVRRSWSDEEKRRIVAQTAERSMKPIALGRKNLLWPFVKHPSNTDPIRANRRPLFLSAIDRVQGARLSRRSLKLLFGDWVPHDDMVSGSCLDLTPGVGLCGKRACLNSCPRVLPDQCPAP